MVPSTGSVLTPGALLGERMGSSELKLEIAVLMNQYLLALLQLKICNSSNDSSYAK